MFHQLDYYEGDVILIFQLLLTKYYLFLYQRMIFSVTVRNVVDIAS